MTGAESLTRRRLLGARAVASRSSRMPPVRGC